MAASGASAFLGSRCALAQRRAAMPAAGPRPAAPSRPAGLQVQAAQSGNGLGPVGITVRSTTNRRPVAKPKQETFKISGRTVVITGGSQGCGRATALLFAKKGFNVVIAARDETKCMYTAEDCAKIAGRQGAALAVPTDVTDEMSVKRLANEALSKYGSIDVVVSNAGVCMSGPFADTKLGDFKALMDINFYGTVNMAHEFMPVLKVASTVKNMPKPAFVVVNSIGGVMPLKFMSAYCASKYALAGFSECLKMEADAMGVHTGQVHPGVVNSNFMERAEFKGPAAVDNRKQMHQVLRSPMAQSPEEVANAVWDCATGYKDEVVVGPLFGTSLAMQRMTGINPSAIAAPFMGGSNGSKFVVES